MRLLYDLKKKEILNDGNTIDNENEIEKSESITGTTIENNGNNNNDNDKINDTENENDGTISEQNKKTKRFKLKKNVKVDIPFSQIQCMVSLDTPNQHKELFNNSSILIGLHPDQATEIIVDLALKLNKPFAIIPCCVFANDFPHRKLKRKKTGNIEDDNEYEEIPVSSYEQFIEYLCAKDKAIQKTFLPFEGKNLLLYKNKS